MLEEVQQHRLNELRLRCDHLSCELHAVNVEKERAFATIKSLSDELRTLRSVVAAEVESASSQSLPDLTALSDISTPLEFHSQGWWDHLLPDGLAQATRGNYRFHLRQLKGDTSDAIQAWIDSSSSLSYKQQRISLAKKIAKISPHISEVPEQDFEWYDVNHTPQVQYAANYAEHEQRFFEAPLDRWTLFIYWLPTRRRDISSLEIVDTMPEGGVGNYFCKDTGEFVWQNYKTSDRYGVQRFALNYLKDILSTDALRKIAEFLAIQPTGRLFPETESTVTRQIKRRTGLTIGESRHNWVTYVAKRHDQADQRQLAHWMAHSYGVAQSTYKN